MYMIGYFYKFKLVIWVLIHWTEHGSRFPKFPQIPLLSQILVYEVVMKYYTWYRNWTFLKNNATVYMREFQRYTSPPLQPLSPKINIHYTARNYPQTLRKFLSSPVLIPTQTNQSTIKFQWTLAFICLLFVSSAKLLRRQSTVPQCSCRFGLVPFRTS